MTNERIWWDGRYLPKGEPWGEVRLFKELCWKANVGRHGEKFEFGLYETEAYAQAAVEQWVREQGAK